MLLNAAPEGDVYVADGAETSLAINPGDGTDLVAAYNEGWNFDPAIPLSTSTDGDVTWDARAFPVGDGSFTGPPFDPWAVPGNTAGEFFASSIRRNAVDGATSHAVIARSSDDGTSFTRFFESTPDVFEDRDMMDLDRTTARGGGSGTLYDGTAYLAYDVYSADHEASDSYMGSFLELISATGSPVMKLQISGPGTESPPFVGSQMQPVAGVTDGTVYIQASATRDVLGATAIAVFHELTNGGAGPNLLSKSWLSWDTAGQQLGDSGRFGVNGHRIDNHGYLAIDRSDGPRHGWLFFISNRNPNPADPTRDQGDVWLSVSQDGAWSWTEAPVPTALGKTQYFPMLDVDDQGWLHVAFYQNEAGATDAGVLNARTANVYYTFSTDGGSTWSPVVQVNAAATALNLEDPPSDLSADEYYLYGDYQQLRATGTGADTTVYVLWSQYDQDRAGALVGDARARVDCTRIAVGGLVTTSTTTSTTTTTSTRTTTTTFPCTTARCILGDAEISSACEDQTIPVRLMAKIIKAENLIDQAATSLPKKARKLKMRAKRALKGAMAKATQATKGRKPKISSDCAEALGQAADSVLVGLGV
jgi:hypothetical protein